MKENYLYFECCCIFSENFYFLYSENSENSDQKASVCATQNANQVEATAEQRFLLYYQFSFHFSLINMRSSKFLSLKCQNEICEIEKKSVWLESDLYMQMKYWHNLIWELQLVNPTVMKCHLCLQGVPPSPRWPAGEYYVQMMTIIYTFANLIVSRVRDVEILPFKLWPELLERIIWREDLCLLYLLDLCLSPRCDIIVIQWIVPRSETLLSPVFDRSV